jgi:hypothetical protein
VRILTLRLSLNASHCYPVLTVTLHLSRIRNIRP